MLQQAAEQVNGCVWFWLAQRFTVCVRTSLRMKPVEQNLQDTSPGGAK